MARFYNYLSPLVIFNQVDNHISPTNQPGKPTGEWSVNELSRKDDAFFLSKQETTGKLLKRTVEPLSISSGKAELKRAANKLDG